MSSSKRKNIYLFLVSVVSNSFQQQNKGENFFIKVYLSFLVFFLMKNDIDVSFKGERNYMS